MNDEIKEILNYLTKFINDKEEITKYGCEISVKQAKQLLDYITNLQQENNNLKTSLDESQEVVIDLQQENEKLNKENEKWWAIIKDYEMDLHDLWNKNNELEQENERLNRQLKHYWKYRTDTEEQKEVYDILELGKDRKNLHKHKNTGGLLWIDLPMTLFSSLTSYIRARDVMLEDNKSRIEKALHLITHSDITDYRVFDEELLNILNGRSDE